MGGEIYFMDAVMLFATVILVSVLLIIGVEITNYRKGK
jgi:hypothetical protein